MRIWNDASTLLQAEAFQNKIIFGLICILRFDFPYVRIQELVTDMQMDQRWRGIRTLIWIYIGKTLNQNSENPRDVRNGCEIDALSSISEEKMVSTQQECQCHQPSILFRGIVGAKVYNVSILIFPDIHHYAKSTVLALLGADGDYLVLHKIRIHVESGLRMFSTRFQGNCSNSLLNLHKAALVHPLTGSVEYLELVALEVQFHVVSCPKKI